MIADRLATWLFGGGENREHKNTPMRRGSITVSGLEKENAEKPEPECDETVV